MRSSMLESTRGALPQRTPKDRWFHRLRYPGSCRSQLPARTGSVDLLGIHPHEVLPAFSNHVNLVASIKSYPARPTPSAPRTPVHRRILVHLGALKIFVFQLIRQTELLIRLILFRTTN